MNLKRSLALCLIVVALIATGSTYLPASALLRFWGAVWLLWLLHGLAWALILDGDWLERALMGTSLAFVIQGLITLILHFSPGPFPVHLARFLALLWIVVPAAWVLWSDRKLGQVQPMAMPSWAVGTILIFAALLRLLNLGYSEFQGDEAVIMQRAAQALTGDEIELFLHQKGPVEILTPMALWSMSGTLNEWQARLPFALVGILAALAVAQLAARWFDAPAGLVAGLLVAANGLLVAFGRIVQYQNIVVLMGALVLLALTRYAQRGWRNDLILGAVFMAYGLLAHYDAVLVALAALLLLAASLVKRREDWWLEIRVLGMAVLVGAVILGIFYVPFMLNPMFERTLAYLSAGRLGGGTLFHNSLPSIWVMSVFYTSLYYVLGLVLLLVLGIGLAFVRHRKPRGGVAQGLGLRGVYVAAAYFLIPLLFYAFIVIDPRTHVYTFYPGAAVLAGAAFSALWTARREVRLLSAGVGLLWYGLCLGYIGLAFIGHQPEYKREWPESRHVLYPVPVDSLPLYGYFGFPYRAGWKAVESLFAGGVLQGTYASNEEPEVTTWYMRSAPRTMCGQPDFYIVAVHVQDEVAIDWGELERDYAPAARITVGGQPKITVYQRRPAPSAPYVLAVEDAIADFDCGTTPDAQLPPAYTGTHPVDVNFGDVARLLGYDISTTRVQPGETVRVTLYWQALSSPRFNYQVFTHLIAEGELLAQHDGAPACAHAPASLWEQGEVVRDEHDIYLDPATPLGDAQLYVGLYDLLTLVRVLVVEQQRDYVLLQSIELVSD